MSVKYPIYMDYQATTPVDPRVLDQMIPFFSENFGNAASKNHLYGREAASAVEKAREQVAKAVGARSQEIIFTSGATESINLAVKGVAEAIGDNKNHFITAATEHKAVFDCFEWLENNECETTVLTVDKYGVLDPTDVKKALRPNTALVSIMTANNEIGVIQPIAEIGAVCRERNVYFMTDATQALGKVPLDVNKMSVDLLACSAHKIYGPKGVGGLYVRRSNPRVKIRSLIDGGGHERGLRSGTLNVPGAVGFGAAVEIAVKEMKKEQLRIKGLRDKLHDGLCEKLDDVVLNGHPDHRLSGNLNVSFSGVESEALMIALKNDVAVSSGSACTTAAVEPSHVLKALGLPDDVVYSSIRFGLGRSTSPEEVDVAVMRVAEEVTRLRSFAC